jgi:hypothetical protein
MQKASRRKIQTLAARGYSPDRIAREVGCSVRTVYRVIGGTAAKPAAPRTAPVPLATPAPVAGGTLVERVRALYELACSVRDGLAPDSDIAGRVAVDLVNLGALLARLEKRAGATPVTEDDIADVCQSFQDRLRALDAANLVCPGCNRVMRRDPEQVRRVDAGIATHRARAAAERAAEPEADRRDEVAGMVEELFESLRSVAATATDPKAAQKYIRQSERLASVLARLERHDRQGWCLDAEALALAEKTRTHFRELAAGVADRPLMCFECSATVRQAEARGIDVAALAAEDDT